ncbi:MAG TPA: tRNA threonylcarbamoyladenosine dehydratase [Cytophagales bacterium]|nr:tRNA threonylcarbamoyladenosine dehydratase [Cytophagales bacterium]
MDLTWLQRTEVLFGAEKIEKLAKSNVLVVGLGGVGSFAAEYIARAGVGAMAIVDGDTVEFTNRNRQLPALINTEGQYKAEIMADRIRNINKDINLEVINAYMTEEKLQQLFESRKFDYVVDAIDTVSPKMSLIKHSLHRGIPLISSMGAGGKVDPMAIKIALIDSTYNCFLAQQVRKNMKKWGIRGTFKAVFSSELQVKARVQMVEGNKHKRSYYGTVSYMPSLFGAYAASVVIRDLVGEKYSLYKHHI